MVDIFPPTPITVTATLQTYPYSATLYANGTLVAAVPGKKIVGNIVVTLSTVGGTGGALSVTIAGTQNGSAVSFTYKCANSGTGSTSTSLAVSLPPNLEFDTNTAITVTFANLALGEATASIGYYLK
jgi:hypothetical protein